jgi:hypothetical protein
MFPYPNSIKLCSSLTVSMSWLSHAWAHNTDAAQYCRTVKGIMVLLSP